MLHLLNFQIQLLPRSQKIDALIKRVVEKESRDRFRKSAVPAQRLQVSWTISRLREIVFLSKNDAVVTRPFCLVESCSQDATANVGVRSVYLTTVLYYHLSVVH